MAAGDIIMCMVTDGDPSFPCGPCSGLVDPCGPEPPADTLTFSSFSPGTLCPGIVSLNFDPLPIIIPNGGGYFWTEQIGSVTYRNEGDDFDSEIAVYIFVACQTIGDVTSFTSIIQSASPNYIQVFNSGPLPNLGLPYVMFNTLTCPGTEPMPPGPNPAMSGGSLVIIP